MTGANNPFIKAAAMGNPVGKRTNIEIQMAAMLAGAGLVFREQVAMYDKWVVDFIVDDRHLIIFTDGLYWHTKPRVAAKDRGQTRYLCKCGWVVLRFTDKQLKTDSNGCLMTILATPIILTSDPPVNRPANQS